MLQIGKFNRLEVARLVDFGAYLKAGNGVEILLPGRYMPDNLQPGDEIDVFVYTDSEDRLIATTEKPYAQVGEAAFLAVSDVNRYGAFLDWGLPKNLLVPYKEQRVKMHKGGVYPVYIYLDDASKRVAATAKIEKYLGNVMPGFKPGDEVQALVWQHGPLGYRVIVDNLWQGMIYDNEIFRPLEVGERVKAFVKRVRGDAKIDLTLSGNAPERVAALSGRILQALRLNGGRVNVTDKSSPELIEARFQCSKKDFKKAVGLLYKERRIIIEDDAIVAVGDPHSSTPGSRQGDD